MRLRNALPALARKNAHAHHFLNSEALEVIVADHCNLTCKQCNHASPAARKRNLTAEGIGADLAILAKSYRPATLKYIGGEPLLNPQIVEIVNAGRLAYPDIKHWLVTNGTLLSRAPDALWEAVDIMDISIYPGQELAEDTMQAFEDKARRFRTRLQVHSFPVFRHTYTSVENRDAALVRDIFHACKMAQVWKCHALYDGRIYRCPQSIYGPLVSGQDFKEGIALSDDPDFADDLRTFLTSDRPLRSCRNCVGTCGKKLDHAMLPRRDWSAHLDQPVAEILDRELMETLLRERRKVDDCKQIVTDQRPPKRSPLEKLAAQARSLLDIGSNPPQP